MARLEGWPDLLLQVITARRKDQQGLGHRVHGLMQQALAQCLCQGGSTRLACDEHRPTLRLEPFGQAGNVRRLACAVDAFEGDEAPCHRVGVLAVI